MFSKDNAGFDADKSAREMRRLTDILLSQPVPSVLNAPAAACPMREDAPAQSLPREEIASFSPTFSDAKFIVPFDSRRKARE